MPRTTTTRQGSQNAVQVLAHHDQVSRIADPSKRTHMPAPKSAHPPVPQATQKRTLTHAFSDIPRYHYNYQKHGWKGTPGPVSRIANPATRTHMPAPQPQASNAGHTLGTVRVQSLKSAPAYPGVVGVGVAAVPTLAMAWRVGVQVFYSAFGLRVPSSIRPSNTSKWEPFRMRGPGELPGTIDLPDVTAPPEIP